MNDKKIELITNLVLERLNYSKTLENMAYRKKDPKFFSEKYIEWSSQGGDYESPTEKPVFEFLQNNYEDLSHEDELIDAILHHLKKINENKKNDNKLNKFLTKIKELVIDEDSYRLINHYKFNKLDGWPDITYGEGGEHPDKIKDGLKSETQTLDLENFDFLKLNDKELQFKGGGDWQYPYIVTVKLVGDKLKVVDSRPYDKKLDKGHGISADDIIKILDAEDLQKKVKEKEAKEKAERCIEQTKEMDFWKNWDVNEILSGIRKNNEYLSQWTLVSKYIKEYVKNNKPMKNENNTTTNLENLIESIVKQLIEGKSNDYMKAIKKADRELEYELNGPGWTSKDKTHKNHKNYDRKRDKKVNIDEATYSFDSEDPNLQQKTDKLKNDTTLFNKEKDEIKINTENKKIVLTKNQIMEMNQLRQLNKKNIFTKNQIIEMLKKKDNL